MKGLTITLTLCLLLFLPLVAVLMERSFAGYDILRFTFSKRKTRHKKLFENFISYYFWEAIVLSAIVIIAVFAAKITTFFAFISYFVILAVFVFLGNRYIKPVGKNREERRLGGALGMSIFALITYLCAISIGLLLPTPNPFWESIVAKAIPTVVFVLLLGFIWFNYLNYLKVAGKGRFFGFLAIVVILITIYTIGLIVHPNCADFLFNSKGMILWDQCCGQPEEKETPLVVWGNNPTAKPEEKPSETPKEEVTTLRTMENGVVYDYTDYLDYAHKDKLNAFGTDKSMYHGDEEATKNEVIKMAEQKPEMLACFCYYLFNDEEKKELKIDVFKEPEELDDYMSLYTHSDAGKLQENLINAFAEALNDSDNTMIKFVIENGYEWTYYMYKTGQDPDDNLTPFGVRLCIDEKIKKRNNALQVEIYRKVYDKKGGGKDGKFTWEKRLDLNEGCGYQMNLKTTPPKTTPRIPADKQPDNPEPTPTPTPTYHKNKNNGTKGEAVQPNDNPKAGEDTNNPSNPKESIKEQPENTGQSGKTVKENEKAEQEKKEVNSEQKEDGPTVKPEPGVTVHEEEVPSEIPLDKEKVGNQPKDGKPNGPVVFSDD